MHGLGFYPHRSASSTASWSASDKAVDMILSNANKTVTRTTNTGAHFYENVRIDVPKTAGAYYFEFDCHGSDTAGRQMISIQNAGFSLTDYPYNSAQGITLVDDGEVLQNNGSLAVAGGLDWYGLGKTGQCCVNVFTKTIWFNVIGGSSLGWNNSGTADPVAGTGGYFYTMLGNQFIMATATRVASETSVINLNTGQSSFVGTPPSGYSNWA